MSFLLGVYEKAFPEDLSIEQMLLHAKEANYDFFELNIDRTEKRIGRLYDPAFLEEIKKTIEKTQFPIEQMGISALSTFTLGNKDPSIRSRGIDILTRSIDFAKEIGCRLIQIPACDVPKDDFGDEVSNNSFIDSLKRIVEYAAEKGILIGMENMENQYSNTIEKTAHIIQRINSPYLQLYPDSGNITNAFDNDPALIDNDFSYAQGHMIAFHLKEVRANKFGGLYYGEGRVNFERIVPIAYNCGARRFVMEYWYTGNPEWQEDLRNANKLFREWVGETND